MERLDTARLLKHLGAKREEAVAREIVQEYRERHAGGTTL